MVVDVVVDFVLDLGVVRGKTPLVVVVDGDDVDLLSRRLLVRSFALVDR